MVDMVENLATQSIDTYLPTKYMGRRNNVSTY